MELLNRRRNLANRQQPASSMDDELIGHAIGLQFFVTEYLVTLA